MSFCDVLQRKQLDLIEKYYKFKKIRKKFNKYIIKYQYILQISFPYFDINHGNEKKLKPFFYLIQAPFTLRSRDKKIYLLCYAPGDIFKRGIRISNIELLCHHGHYQQKNGLENSFNFFYLDISIVRENMIFSYGRFSHLILLLAADNYLFYLPFFYTYN